MLEQGALNGKRLHLKIEDRARQRCDALVEGEKIIPEKAKDIQIYRGQSFSGIIPGFGVA